MGKFVLCHCAKIAIYVTTLLAKCVQGHGGDMKVSSELPTIFAKNLGIRCKLLLKQKNGVDHGKLGELNERMQWFQQMSVTSSFNDCVAVYYGMELNDDQISVLKLIHRTTRPWMTGHIVGVCLERIDQGGMNKDFAESVRVLIEQLGETNSEDLGKRMKGIMIKSTRTQIANSK